MKRRYIRKKNIISKVRGNVQMFKEIPQMIGNYSINPPPSRPKDVDKKNVYKCSKISSTVVFISAEDVILTTCRISIYLK